MGNVIHSAVITGREKDIPIELKSRESKKDDIRERRIGVDERERHFLNYSKNIKEDLTRQKQCNQTETIELSANGQNEQLANAVFAEIYGSTPSLEPSLPPPPPKFKLRTLEEIRDEMKPVVKLTSCCSQCQIGFSNFSKLRVHVQAYHFCFVCLRYFFDVSNLLEHSDAVHKDMIFPCSRCEDDAEPFSSSDSLLVHNSLKHSRDFQTNCLFCNFNDEGNPAAMWKHLVSHLMGDARKFQERHQLPLDHTLDVYVLYGTRDSERRRSNSVLPVHYYIMPLEEAQLRQARRQDRLQIARSGSVTSSAAFTSLVPLQPCNASQTRRKHEDRDSEGDSLLTTRKKLKCAKEERHLVPVLREFSGTDNIFKPIVSICQTIKIDVKFQDFDEKPTNAKINYQAHHLQSFRVKGTSRTNARHKRTYSGRF